MRNFIFFFALIFILANLSFLRAQEPTDSIPTDAVPSDASTTEDEKQEAVVQPAKLLVYKKAPEATVVNGEWTVDITIYNVGDKNALNIELNDGFWAPEVFQAVKGSTSEKFEVLKPGEYVSHSYTISGKTLGEYETTQTTVTYKSEEESAESEGSTPVVHVSRSNPIPPVRVLTQSQYDKLNAKKFPVPIAYALLSIIPVILPALLHLYANNQIARFADGALKKDTN